MKPIIGITANFSTEDEIGTKFNMGAKNQSWHLLADDYIKAVEVAGGIPVIIPVIDAYEELKSLIKRLDGVILSGGSDVSPILYGKDTNVETGVLELNRDLQESFIARYIIENTEIPLFGICRGSQIMNVSMGGSLIQDISNEEGINHADFKQKMNFLSHRIAIRENTLLKEIIKKDCELINSFHHQSVKDLGKDFKISATAFDDVVEAIEMPSRKSFTLGVQWHPEGIFKTSDSQMNIFIEFIRESLNKKEVMVNG